MQYITAKLTFEYITKEEFFPKNIAKKLLIQNALYLGNECGAYTGDYIWNLTKRGMESKSLFVVMSYDYRNDESRKYAVKEPVKESLQPLVHLIESPLEDFSKAEWVKMLAITQYTYKYNSIHKTGSEITKILNRNGYQFNQSIVDRTLNELRKKNMIPLERKGR